MFEKFSAFLGLFRKGQEIANVDAWKSGGISAAALSAFILAIVSVANAFGKQIPISADQANAIAAGIIAVVGVVLPIITSKRAGILPATSEQPVSTIDQPKPDPVSTVATPTSTAAKQPTSVSPLRQAADGSVIDTSWEQTYRGG